MLSQKTLISWTALVSLVLIGTGFGCNKKQAEPQTQNPSTSTAPVTETTGATGGANELKIDNLKVGTGREATPGKTVTVHYTGWLTDGKKFDSSVDRNQPFKFSLGAGQVIAGWEKGVQGMKVGGKRKLTIPPQMGYGASGAGGVIPPHATLLFEVELLGVE